MNHPYLYLKLLRKLDHTVLAVSDGQKKYYHPVFSRNLPFSGGQQVKRSILELVLDLLGEPRSQTTFVWDVNIDKFSEGEVLSLCNPTYADQLLGGWMNIPQGGKIKSLKRRSPLSISALRPLHPSLATVQNREALTFDRSDEPHRHRIVVRQRDEHGQVRELAESELSDLLSDQNRSLLKKWIPADKNSRLTGVFLEEVAIDLRRLFSVSINELEPEISVETRRQLESSGWELVQSELGDSLVCPPARREQIARALAHALLNWRITSNQARTYSPQEVLAVAISTRANRLAPTIRARVTGVAGEAAEIVVDDTIPDTYVYKTPVLEEFIVTTGVDVLALDRAEEKLNELLLS